jgi:CheY-like chemotaxis protein
MKKNILVVDDDEDSLVLLVEVLRYADFDACGIQQTSDIFEVINKVKPDLILMDYILKDINGGELCHQVKTNANTAHLPVVLISAYPRVLESLGRYGCDAFITKPVEINHLIASINDCLHVSV